MKAGIMGLDILRSILMLSIGSGVELVPLPRIARPSVAPFVEKLLTRLAGVVIPLPLAMWTLLPGLVTRLELANGAPSDVIAFSKL